MKLLRNNDSGNLFGVNTHYVDLETAARPCNNPHTPLEKHNCFSLMLGPGKPE